MIEEAINPCYQSQPYEEENRGQSDKNPSAEQSTRKKPRFLSD